MERPGFLQRMFAPLGRLTDFGGRTRRSDYWPFLLLLFGLYLLGLFATMAGMSAGLGLSIAPAYAMVALIALLGLAATVRRLHDAGWSGWWAGICVAMVLSFVLFYFYARHLAAPPLDPDEPSMLVRFWPIVMPVGLAMNLLGLFLLLLVALDGTPGPNRYGPDPKGRTSP